MSTNAESQPNTVDPHSLIREKVGEYIKEEYIDDVMERPIPLFDGITLNEAIIADPLLAQAIVDEMFSWEKANPGSS